MSPEFDIITSTRPLEGMGIDPSSRLGAHIIAARLRLYWLERGKDIPVEVSMTVPSSDIGKKKAKPVYGAKLNWSEARSVSFDEATILMALMLEEASPLMASARRHTQDYEVAA